MSGEFFEYTTAHAPKLLVIYLWAPCGQAKGKYLGKSRPRYVMDAETSVRVIRGPDWEWGDQDGGEGHVGTVVEVGDQNSDNIPRSAVVQWDRGERSKYRCGLAGKYDLRVVDNGPAGTRHRNVTCDECHQNSIPGIRWKCAQCHNFDLCTHCYMEGKHNCDHTFLRYSIPQHRSRVAPRRNCTQVEIQGAYPGADVVRGKDWNLEDKDGGEGGLGKIIILSDVENESYRGVAEVEWEKTGLITTCRVGHEGKVDIHCIAPETVGKYYIDHLPILGAPNIPAGLQEFSPGDVVQVELGTELFMLLQEGHGGWNDKMAELHGRRGMIHHIKDSGDLLVVYGGAAAYVINPAAVFKVDVKPVFKPGDVVRIMDDRAEVTKLQKGHGEWTEDMLESLGQTGVVQQVDSLGDAKVLVKHHLWWFNSECLSLKTEKSDEGTDQGQTQILGEDEAELRRKMELLKAIGDANVLALAALLGEEEVIKEYLDEYPNDVNSKYSNKTALHCAAAAGRTSVVKLLIDYQADIHAQDEIGLTPLHHCAIRNEKEAAIVLLEAGADPNIQTATGLSPISVAIHKNSKDVLELLANYKKIDLCSPNHGGDTPLHVAVTEQSLSSVNVLLQAGADVTAVNFKFCTPMHVAAELGFTVLVEEFLQHHPEHINLKAGEIDLTLLHFAAVRDNLEVANFLLMQPTCDTEATSSTLMMPFLIAVVSGSLRVVERLVSFGANIAAVDEDGDTALHLVVRNTNPQYSLPTHESPEIKKVQGILGGNPTPEAVLCCFLIYVGVDMNTENYAGSSPLELCDPVLAVTIASFAEQHEGESKLHGSLKQLTNEDKEDNDSYCNELQASNKQHNDEPELASEGAPLSSLSTLTETGSKVDTSQVEMPVSSHTPTMDFHQQVLEQFHSDTFHNVMSTKEEGHTSYDRDKESSRYVANSVSQTTCAERNPIATNHVSHVPAVSVASSIGLKCESDHDSGSSTSRSDQPICILCDEPATVRLLPCGHQIICLMCSKRAKKCLQCKRIVTARVNLSAL